MNINMNNENKETELSFYNPAPTPLQETKELNNIYYNCTKCPSLIEIISINENKNIIEFKCVNKNNIHNNGNIIISIKDYLRLMLNNKNENLNDRCEIHKYNNYICYCYECERQLCNECLKTKIHTTHKKIIISELQPDEGELNLIKKKLEEFGKIINELEIQKQKKTIVLNKLNIYKINENKILGDLINKNEINKEKELKLSENKYINSLKEIKKRFEKDIKLRKLIYEKEKRNINNKYKIKNDKEKIKYLYKIQKINENQNGIINDLSKKIDNLSDIKRLNEIIFKTYNEFKYNYYYVVNLKRIISIFKNCNSYSDIEKQNSKFIDQERQKTKIINQERQNNKFSMQEIQNNKLINKKFQNNLLINQEIQNNKLINQEVQNNDVIIKEIKNNKLINQEVQNNYLIIQKIQDNKRINKEVQNSDLINKEVLYNDLINEEIANNEIINQEVQNNKLINLEQQNNKLINLEQQNNKLIAQEGQNNKLINLEQQNNDLINKEIQNNNLINQEVQNNNLINKEVQNNKLIKLINLELQNNLINQEVQNNILINQEIPNNELIDQEGQNNKLNIENFSYDSIIIKLKLKEEKRISEKKEKYNYIENYLNEQKNIFCSYDILKKNINRNNQYKINTYNNEKEKDNLKKMVSYCSEFLNLKDENNTNLVKIINELKGMKEIEDKEKDELLSKVQILKDNNKYKRNEKKSIKKASGYVGLRNIGGYCYLNSVIQQLFYIPQFKYSIMNVDDKKEPKKSDKLEDDNILHQLQKLFVYLSFTSYGEVIPSEFAGSVKDYNGKPIGPNMDSQEFYLNLCDKIEESLKGTKSQYLIQNLFIGKLCHKNTCNSCKYDSFRYEDFKNISLEVKDIKNIYDSFDKYVSSENIEDYNCSNCRKKVTIKRKTLLSNLPNILVIRLNRIIFDYKNEEQTKINSKFEFPIELNLKKYCLEKYEKKYEYYKYELRGVILNKGDNLGGQYSSIIKVDKNKWYKFVDSKVNEFNIENLGEECFGGINKNTKEEKKNSAYLLFYELLKKKPIIIKFNDYEANEFKLKNNKSVISYNKNNLQEIEEKYDITKLSNSYNEEDLYNKMFYNNDEYSYYKYIPYNDIQKYVNKTYFSEVFNDNKIYDYIYGNNKVINFKNSLIQILTKIIKNESFNIINKKLKSEEYRNLLNIFIELIISYFLDDNLKKNRNDNNIQNINVIIAKIFFPLFKKENEYLFKDFKINDFTLLINDNLFSLNNIKLIFLQPINLEICDKIYELFLKLIKKNNNNQNQKLNVSLNIIINQGENLSYFIFKMLFELIKDENLSEIIEESFLVVYYKLNSENENNKKEILKILEYLICKKKILIKSIKVKKELEENLNIFAIKNFFDSSIEVLILLTKELQINNKKYSELFNKNYIQQLYTYCSKDENLMKEKQIKLIKLIIAILGINDEFIINRIKILLGYPTLVFKKNNENNISLFGFNIMNNDINTEIYEYISYNHIKKERCLLSLLFPSYHRNNEENKLDINDRNDLIYELINNCLGLNEVKEGNYILFKTIYLMQTRSIKYNNLYEEIKEILENANQNNNKKYNINNIEKAEKECIDMIKYETDNENYNIESKRRPKRYSFDRKLNIKPRLSEVFKSSQLLIGDQINKEYIGNVSNFIPHEIGKIKITFFAGNKDISIFRFEYFTSYFTRNELISLSEEKIKFNFNGAKKRNIFENNNNEDYNYDRLMLDFSVLEEVENIIDFLFFLNENINGNKNKMIVIENEDVIKKKTIKSSLIRYFLISKNKEVFKINIIKKESNRGILNNFYLPDNIINFVEENGFCNLLNIYRIKDEFKFLPESIEINIRTLNAEKYFKEYFE